MLESHRRGSIEWPVVVFTGIFMVFFIALYAGMLFLMFRYGAPVLDRLATWYGGWLLKSDVIGLISTYALAAILYGLARHGWSSWEKAWREKKGGDRFGVAGFTLLILTPGIPISLAALPLGRTDGYWHLGYDWMVNSPESTQVIIAIATLGWMHLAMLGVFILTITATVLDWRQHRREKREKIT